MAKPMEPASEPDEYLAHEPGGVPGTQVRVAPSGWGYEADGQRADQCPAEEQQPKRIGGEAWQRHGTLDRKTRLTLGVPV